MGDAQAVSGREWLASQDRPPTEAEQLNLLRAPLKVFVVGMLWLLAAFVFGGLNATYAFEIAQRVGVTVVLAGLATCAGRLPADASGCCGRSPRGR